MEVHFGWGSRSVKFVPAGDGKMAHVAWVHRERGGYDASPTGISYHWWSEPQTLPLLIAELQGVYAEYEKWLVEEFIRYRDEGSPLSQEQIEMIEKHTAKV